MYPEKKLSIIDHLDELRKRILLCLAAVTVFAVVGYIFFDPVLRILTAPAKEVITKFYFFAPQDAFIVRIKTAFFAGLIAAAPLIFYHAWRFVTPGLVEKERRLLIPMSLLATVLFLTGVLFCYYTVLPIGIKFLLGFCVNRLVPMIDIDAYLQFVTTLLLAFGILFLLPIIIYLLARFNIVSPKTLASQRGNIVIAIFIIAAIVTPSTDPMSQVALALPMWALFEISLFIVKRIYKK
jgi:sec-independent protein translocase protein TatC